ncbi:phospholipid-translocating P-type ATPase, flippase subfamily protein [Besnoitia besnoiti]|uniref:Phospholipid-translocating P-type ATPase, flippase subfamily protein n=1 Tax=Besnoitia besnoiti TaxID=94643 RepID=A0A2A9MM37_BESBE|nr:phospholipid-translocating P-type ATPase, flippase subfamily protein [Besnoitia besnoiti]PFH38354.1 phospholipid-translocating P-type ATPase, flippase subfamily protein [Besnoitia besnoiti]
MGLWRDICPFLFWAAEWLWSVLPSRAAVISCLPCGSLCLRLCCRSAAKTKEEDGEGAQKNVGMLAVRTHTPSQLQPDSPGNSHFHLAKWTNAIRTTEYTWWNFLPKNLWSQISQPANFYFLVMAVMQMVPQISDSDGLPTFLFPLSLVMFITAAKDAYENVKRTRADQEENDRLCRVVNASGEVQLVPWRNLRPGNIVKLHCDEAVPADILMLNCADEYGVAYVETVQLDGETNLKHKMCIPEIADAVETDHDASLLSLEVNYEPPSAELYKFTGVVTLNPTAARQPRQSVLAWGRTSLAQLHTGSQRPSPRATPQLVAQSGPLATPRANSVTSSALARVSVETRRSQAGGVPLLSPTAAGSGREEEKNRRRSSLMPLRSQPSATGGGAPFSRESSLSQARASKARSSVTATPGGTAVGCGVCLDPGAELTPSPPNAPQQFSVDISQFLWRGATLRNTAWAYGVVLYAGQHTRIMKNTRSRELKYSRLQVYYNQHALLLAIFQFLLCIIAATAFASHNQNMSDNAWYLESTWESGIGNFFASLGVSFGQYVLLLSYFVPITLLVQLEVCRACQAGFLSVDERMYCPATEQKASAQSVALMEELGSITHVFSDKTGTLTQNLMQFRCLAVGDTLHGFDEYQEMKSFVSHSSVVSATDAFERAGHGTSSFRHSTSTRKSKGDAENDDAISPNKYVHFNARLFAQRMRKASKINQQKAADLLMVMALCHSVLPKQDMQTPTTNPLGADRMPAKDRDDVSCSSSVSVTPREKDSRRKSSQRKSLLLGPRDGDALFSSSPALPLTDAERASASSLASTSQLATSPIACDKEPLTGAAGAGGSPKISVMRPAPREESSPEGQKRFSLADSQQHAAAPPSRVGRAERGESTSPFFVSLPGSSRLGSSNEASPHNSPREGGFAEEQALIPRFNKATAHEAVWGASRAHALCAFDASPVDLDSEDEKHTCMHCGRRIDGGVGPELEESDDDAPALAGSALPRLCDSALCPPSASPSFVAAEELADALCKDVGKAGGARIPTESRTKEKFVRREPQREATEHDLFTLGVYRPQSFQPSSLSPSPVFFRAPVAAALPPPLPPSLPPRPSLGSPAGVSPLSVLSSPLASPCHSSSVDRARAPSASPSRREAMLRDEEAFERDQQRDEAGGLLAVQLAAVRLTKEVEYDASSPDELALTAAAKHLGAEMICRPSLSTIQIGLTTAYAESCLLSQADRAYLQQLREQQAQPADAAAAGGTEAHGTESLLSVPLVIFDVLEVLEFDNFRKRMSVVIRDRHGRLRLLVKGADSSMLDIAAPGQDGMKQDLKEQLSEMASQGLRTLVMGQRYLSEKQFQKYRAMLISAKAMTGDQKEEALNAALAKIERNIELLGASGIDDKLQDEVAETISDIKQAGVKLWVLTGDKMETAIAIGHSCSILSEATYNAIVDGTSEEMVREQLHQYMSYIVAAQLASEAFEQIALKSMVDRGASDVSDVSEALRRRGTDRSTRGASADAKQSIAARKSVAARRPVRTPGQCLHCLAGVVQQRARCVGGRTSEDSEEDSVRGRQARQAPPSMPWEDFVKILTFNANRKVVKADPKQRKFKRLSPGQVEDIVQEYLEHFDKSSEENQKERTRRAKSSRGRSLKSGSGTLPSSFQNGPSSASSRVASQRERERCREARSGDEEEAQATRDRQETVLRAQGGGGEKAAKRAVSFPRHSLFQRKGDEKGGAEDDEKAQLAPGSNDQENESDRDEAKAFASCRLNSQKMLSSPWDEIDTARTRSKDDQQSRASKYPSSSGESNAGGMREAAVEGYEACAITITGEALTHALSTAENRRYFFGLANLCSTVIACRVSPKQKSDVVTQCKRYQSGTVSLGIGDGANDVGMLVAANVGVGIRGKEGLQAVRAADFAIGEFKFVRNLMFCHGREALRRNAFQMYQTIFKNVIFGLADLFFAFLSIFSASDLFNPWLKQLYNVLYTCIPVILFTIFDRQLPYDILLHTPVLYPAFSKLGVNMFAGSRTFWKWLLFAFYASATLVYIPIYGLGWATVFTGGDGIITLPVAFEGAVVFWCIILVCNLVMIPFLHTWFWFIWLGVFVDFGFWFLSLIICPRLPAGFCTDLCGSLEAIHHDGRYYFATTLAVILALLPQYLIWFLKTTFRPSAPCVIRERIAKGVFDVVIAPRGGQKMAVVVPKKVSNEWRGFAFAEQDHTRWGQHRRSVRALLDNQISSRFLQGNADLNVPFLTAMRAAERVSGGEEDAVNFAGEGAQLANSQSSEIVSAPAVEPTLNPPSSEPAPSGAELHEEKQEGSEQE